MTVLRQPGRAEAIVPGLVLLAAVVIGVALAALLVAPRAAPFLLLAVALPALALSRPSDITAEDLGRAPMAAVLAFVLYLTVNWIWSYEPLDGLGKALLSAAIVMVVWLSWRGLVVMPDAVLTHMARAATIAFLLGLVYLAVEEVTQHQIKRGVFNAIPLLRPSAKHIALDQDTVNSVEVYLSNRSMGALALVLWPMLLIIGWHGAWRRLAAVGVLVLAAFTALRSSHETTAIALALSLAAAGLALRWRNLAIVIVAIGWLVSTLLVVQIVSRPEIKNLHAAEWLPKSARHRIVIWEYTAEQVVKAPVLGIGIGSGKYLDARREKQEPPPGYQFERRAGTHAHNLYLQAWYELGAIGAVLLCTAGLSLLVSMTRLPAETQPTALATFVAAASTAAFSWGMWQPWFMAAFGMSALLFMMAAEVHRRRCQQAARPAPGLRS